MTFTVIFLRALTAVVPFLFIRDLLFALRVSNGKQALAAKTCCHVAT